MKKHHLFAYYCTLLVPIGAIIGAGVGSAHGSSLIWTTVGVATGVAVSWLLMRSSASSETS